MLPETYASAPVVELKVTANVSALAPVFKPTTWTPDWRSASPVLFWKAILNLSGPKIWCPIGKSTPKSIWGLKPVYYVRLSKLIEHNEY